MRCDEVRTSLADFLSGEMTSADAAGVQRHLQNCAACAQEVRGLREALLSLQAGAISDHAASQLAAQVELEFAGGSQAIRSPYARMAALLRYAAVIAISFGAGYSLRPVANAGAVRAPDAKDSGLVIVRRYEAASRAYPKAAGMSRGLLALANAEQTRQ